MPILIESPPHSRIEPVTDILHGIPVTDPYRWLEDQDLPETQQWITAQQSYARSYLDVIAGREQIRKRIRELLDVETYDSLLQAGNRYLFRKRVPGQEQSSIFVREGPDGEDRLLINPADRGTGKYTSVSPLLLSSDANLLLYAVKEGGERTGVFELFNIEAGRALSDSLPRGYLRGFAFGPDNTGFYYSHELSTDNTFPNLLVRYHPLGADFTQDQEIFCAGEDERVRVCLISDEQYLGILVYRFLEKVHTDFYLRPLHLGVQAQIVLTDIDYFFGPVLAHGRLLGITDRDAPNLRIVELCFNQDREPEWIELVPETDSRIQQWLVARDRIFVSYVRQTATQIHSFGLNGKRTGEIPIRLDQSARLVGGSPNSNEVFIETESFTEPIRITCHSAETQQATSWAERHVPFDPTDYSHTQVWYRSADGTAIPMLLMGRRDVVESGCHPVIMTAYGGYGLSMTPRFSVFVAFLVERGCLFALPSIRGGAEFGSAWHKAAKRRNRQKAYDDFLSAAEWLIQTGRTSPNQLAIFGGSNSGLLVGAAMTQRPDLFRAVLCMTPLLDMLRYHLFDDAQVWRDEFGCADDPEDFEVLLNCSPYHQVQDGVTYPATMLVSGDEDRNCNALHARKMTARLQAANASSYPVVLDYARHRGHSPVLPLSERVEALTDRMAFLCDQLSLLP